ncbi:MAG: TonB family protein [Opitutaceae bacterium]|nr:TonB family protein [Opitutaceae bacterium]
MKASLCRSLFLVLVAATPLLAAFKSVKLPPDNPLPEFPLELVNDGVSQGEVVMAISVSAEGRAVDSLVLAYTHEPFATACRQVLPEWRFIPAQLDGVNVGVKIELTFNFERTGYVESNRINITNKYLQAGRSPALSRLLIGSDKVDKPPVALSTVNPRYAAAARSDGVRGTVRVTFYIDEKGTVRLPTVSSESHPYLADIAVEALRSWRFQPALYRGKPVIVAAAQDFRFGSEP